MEENTSQLRILFDRVDIDGDGFIGEHEVSRFILSSSINILFVQVRNLLLRCNQQQEQSEEEGMRAAQEARDIFSKLDRDSDGKVR